MKYRITLNLSAVGHLMKVYAKHEYVEEETKQHFEEIYLAVLKSCKKADKKAFYNALAKFAAEDFDDAKEYIEKELNNES